jgi:hypothetical protein
VDPLSLTEYAVIFSIPVLPLTYLPIMLVGNDRELTGRHVNGPVAGVLGWTYFGPHTRARSGRAGALHCDERRRLGGELRSLNLGSAARPRPSAFAPLAGPPGGGGARAG